MGVASWTTPSYASLKEKDLIAEKLFEIEDEVIWGFTFLNSSEVLLTLRKGDLYHFNLKNKKLKKIKTFDVFAYGQGGLLDVQMFKVEGKETLYFTYSKKVKGKATTALARAYWVKDNLTDFQDIFVAKAENDKTIHFGSRLAFDGKHLFMTVGERNQRHLSQTLNNHHGKILRLLPNGKPAPENPFVKKGGLPEIYSFGHRNPQGIFWDDKRKILFSCEFGPRGGDEINIIKPGLNYGWPVITYGSEYYGPKIGEEKKEGMEQPLAYWVPSISPSGMTVYQGNAISEWKGDIFLANLSSSHLRRLKFVDGKITEQQELFKGMDERIRFVSEGPDGRLYFSTDSGMFFGVSKKN